jgi:thioredoxin 1
MLAPVIEEIAKEDHGKIKVGKLDVDENPKTTKQYGVMSIPTVIIFKEGKEVARKVGLTGKEAYRKLIEEIFKLT